MAERRDLPLRITGLDIGYGARCVASGINLEVREGEFLALV